MTEEKRCDMAHATTENLFMCCTPSGTINHIEAVYRTKCAVTGTRFLRLTADWRHEYDIVTVPAGTVLHTEWWHSRAHYHVQGQPEAWFEMNDVQSAEDKLERLWGKGRHYWERNQ